MNERLLVAILSSIKPDKQIICGRRGSEENVKVKIILPLIEFLGFNLINDSDFELLGTDIVLFDNASNPVLIIETKAWEQPLSIHLNQCIEYCFKLSVPLILITSGQYFALYSALGNLDGLAGSKSLLEFTFNDLIGDDGEKILNKLKSLIGREELSADGANLHHLMEDKFGSVDKIEIARSEFFNKSSEFTTTIKSFKINDSEFDNAASKHNEEIKNALLWCRDEFKRIAKENKNISLGYRSSSLGLKYFYDDGPRSKVLGLVGIYPEKPGFAFGREDWKKINCPPEYLEKINSFSSKLKTEKQAEDLIRLVEAAIKSINKPI